MAATQPSTSKEQVRAYMERRQGECKPPPDRDEIRRQLGMGMLQGVDLRYRETAEDRDN